MDYADLHQWQELVDAFLETAVPRPTLNCGLVHCEPQWRWDVTMTDYDLWLVLDGYGLATIDGEPYPLAPGSLLVLPPGSTGHVQHDPARPLTVVYCHYVLRDPHSGAVVHLPASLLPRTWRQLTATAAISDQLQSLVRLATDTHPISTVRRSTLLVEVLLEVYRSDAAQSGHGLSAIDPRIAKVMAMVQSQPGRRTTLSEVSRHAGLSAQHFSRLFSAQTGTSFREFALETRLQRGRQLLEESTLSVTQVAHALGYDEVYLFSRQMRARFGSSPTLLRQADATSPARPFAPVREVKARR